MIKTLVIDDEKVIRNSLKETLEESGEFEIIGEADDVDSAIESIEKHQPDLVFLDIKLIGGTAFDVLDKLQLRHISIPPIIINTGFNQFEYASKILNDYKDHVILILEKPFWEDWNEKKDDILTRYYDFKRQLITKKDMLVIKANRNSYLIHFEDLILLEVSTEKSQGKLYLHSKRKTYEVFRTLNSIMGELPSQFLRVSRYAAINVQFISYFDHSMQMIYLHEHDEGVGVGNSYKDELLRYIS